MLVTTHLIAEWNNAAHRCLLCRDGKVERELDPTNLLGDLDSGETEPPEDVFDEVISPMVPAVQAWVP